MSFFEELKRRNVFRVGIAYAVASWVLLQVVDLVLDNVEAPDWVMGVFMLVVLLGFVVSLIIAWAYEMTPEGIKKESEVDRSQSIVGDTGRKLDRIIIGFLAAVVVLLLAHRYFPEKGSDTFSGENTPTLSDTTDQKMYPAPFLEKALGHLQHALDLGASFPMSDIALFPEYQDLKAEPRFRQLTLRAYEQFNRQRVLAGLAPVDPEQG